MKILKETFQQGDVLFRRLDTLPEGEQKVIAHGRLVVAHGESGHKHTVGTPESDSELIQVGEQMLVNLKSDQLSSHEEHNAPGSLLPEPVMLAAGIWEIGRVEEVDHFANVTRTVID